MWFTETPWPPMIILAVAAIACGWMGIARRQSWWLVGAIVCVALTIGVMVFERSIVTPREQIEQNLLDLAQAFQDRDEDETLSYVSLREDKLRQQVQLGFLTVTRVEHLRITDTEVALLADGSQAKQRFRANGTFTVAGFGDVGHKPTHWMLTWQQEAGLWKVIGVQRLDTITGEPIEMLDPRE